MPYIPFTEEEKMTANSVDLAEYLRVRGEKLERAGREYKLIYSDDSGSLKSFCFSDCLVDFSGTEDREVTLCPNNSCTAVGKSIP